MNAINLYKLKTMIESAKLIFVKSVDIKYPIGLTFIEDEEPSEEFLASCEKGIFTPIVVDADMNLIDGVKRCIGAFTAQHDSCPCLVVQSLEEHERIAYRKLMNPDRGELSERCKKLIAGRVNFSRSPNMRYRSDILKIARNAVQQRAENIDILFKKSVGLMESTFLRRQIKIAESAAVAVQQLDQLISFYESPPDSLLRCRKKLADAIKTIVEFRQQTKIKQEKKP